MLLPGSSSSKLTGPRYQRPATVGKHFVYCCFSQRTVQGQILIVEGLGAFSNYEAYVLSTQAKEQLRQAQEEADMLRRKAAAAAGALDARAAALADKEAATAEQRAALASRQQAMQKREVGCAFSPFPLCVPLLSQTSAWLCMISVQQTHMHRQFHYPFESLHIGWVNFVARARSLSLHLWF